MTTVAVTGSFDDLRSRHVRLLEEAGRLGDVHVILWSDELTAALQGKSPKFPVTEREYFLQSLRFVKQISIVRDPFEPHTLPGLARLKPAAWVVDEAENTPEKQRFCRENGLDYRVISEKQMKQFPALPSPRDVSLPGRKKVLVTGCFDWLHTGHVRFFEEVSELGDVYVCAGHDANIELLKGPGHPMFRENERCYMTGAIRYVKQSLITTGSGWLDAEPEIRLIRPDIYAVNEDGDKAEKKEFCAKNDIEYVVLKRLPKPGLVRRQSTELRGF